jgi:hypothetical protein
MSTIATPPETTRQAFAERAMRAIRVLSQTLDETALLQALTASTDTGVLARSLVRDESLEEADPLLAARLRGMNAKREILQSHGGTVSGAKAAEILHISRQAVDKRRLQGKLIAVELGKKGFHYPIWQFDLPGLEEVLAELQGHDAWTQLSFFLNPHGLLDGKTPLDALRAKDRKRWLAEVKRAAATLTENG